jgi:hypothetical protein
MADTYWYAYDGRGGASGPYYATKADAADACDEGETPRPVSGAVIDTDATGDESETDDGDGEPDASDDRPRDPPLTELQAQFDRGVCPWCDDYEGEHVGRHASSAHAEKWQRFKAARQDA